MRDMICILSGLLVFIVLAFFIAYGIEVASCENRAISFDDNRFEVFGGCLVKHEDRWLPLENIRGFN